jgi:lipopolysaccharide export system permease protein
MDILDRYLVKEFVLYFFAIHFGLGVLGLSIDFLSHMWEVKLGLGRLFLLYGYKFPFYLQQFFPLAVLLATLVLLTSMSRQNEILALFAGGIGSFRIVSTLVAVVATISTFYFLAFDSWVPAFNGRRVFLEQGIEPAEQIVLSRPEGGFWYRSRNLVYNIGRYLPEKNRMEDVSIYFLDRHFRLSHKLHAQDANFNGQDWILNKGFMVRYPEPGFPERELFETLDSIIPEKPTDFKAIRVQEESMRLRELRRYLSTHDGSGLDTTATKVHYHERLAQVFSPLIFLLVAIPLGIQPMKSRTLMRNVAIAFMIALAYLAFSRLSISIGRGGFMPAYVAAWFPNVIFLGVSFFLLTKKSS